MKRRYMRTAHWIEALAVTTLLASACGVVSPSAARNMATPPAEVSVQPAVSPLALPMPSPAAVGPWHIAQAAALVVEYRAHESPQQFFSWLAA